MDPPYRNQPPFSVHAITFGCEYSLLKKTTLPIITTVNKHTYLFLPSFPIYLRAQRRDDKAATNQPPPPPPQSLHQPQATADTITTIARFSFSTTLNKIRSGSHALRTRWVLLVSTSCVTKQTYILLRYTVWRNRLRPSLLWQINLASPTLISTVQQMTPGLHG